MRCIKESGNLLSWVHPLSRCHWNRNSRLGHERLNPSFDRSVVSSRMTNIKSSLIYLNLTILMRRWNASLFGEPVKNGFSLTLTDGWKSTNVQGSDKAVTHRPVSIDRERGGLASEHRGLIGVSELRMRSFFDRPAFFHSTRTRLSWRRDLRIRHPFPLLQ